MQFELTPFPMAIFNDAGLRKGNKSSLYDAFQEVEQVAHDLIQSTNVIDGGFPLHRVKWNVATKVSTTCDQYINDVKKHYGHYCTVVFDGNGDAKSTKRAEQKRRSRTKTSAGIHFNETTNIIVQQEHFLANEKNKTRLIELLSDKMKLNGIETVVAEGDADSTIVRCGLEKAAIRPSVTIIGEDVDLIVLLIALT